MLTETSRTRIILMIVLLAIVGAVVAGITFGTSPFHIVMICIFAISAAIVAAMFAVVVN